MTFSAKLAARSAAVLAVGALALTACTTASETGGGAGTPTGTATAAAFDPSTVSEDATLAAQVPAPIKSKGKLVVGSDTSYAPAEFLGGSDNATPMGYDVDLAKAIGAKLGLDVEVQTAEFTGILPALGPKYDLGISSFTINPERLAAVNFVSYFEAGTAWAVQKGNPKNFSLDDVCGKKIGVQTGTVQEDPDLKTRNQECQDAGKPAIEIVSLKTQTDINTRLVSGALDAMVADSPIIGYAITQTNGAVEKIGEPYDSAVQGIAVAKSDLPLAGLIQKTLQSLMDDGTYLEILKAWGNEDGAISKPEVNPAV
jgi:polar amino acid transport system substrate-binding protein